MLNVRNTKAITIPRRANTDVTKNAAGSMCKGLSTTISRSDGGPSPVYR